MESTFKSSVFGGFNRDDVIRYIEKTALESKDRIESLEQEIDALCRENADLRSQVSSSIAERDRLSSSCEALLGQMESVKGTVVEATEQIASLRAQVSSLEQEKASLLAQVSQLQQQADEYAAVKTHISEIELSARQRANELENDTCSRLSDMVAACRRQCELVISTLGTTCASVSDELRSLDASVTQLPDAFGTLCGELEELGHFE